MTEIRRNALYLLRPTRVEHCRRHEKEFDIRRSLLPLGLITSGQLHCDVPASVERNRGSALRRIRLNTNQRSAGNTSVFNLLMRLRNLR